MTSGRRWERNALIALGAVVPARERADTIPVRPDLGRTLLRCALIILMSIAVAMPWPSPAAAQENRRFVWDRVDVAVQLRDDGSFAVSERDRALFTGGPFQEGYRDIPLARIERIDNIRVGEVSKGALQPYHFVSPDSFTRTVPNTYSFEWIGSSVHIQWSFSPTTSQSRTFEITYRAHGALRVYADAPTPYQQISWAGADRELTKDAPVNTASLTYILPRPVDPDKTHVEGPGGPRPRDHTQDGKSWTWTARDLGPGESLGAILQFPPLVRATKPSWQDASDRGERLVWERAARNPQLNLLFLGLALLIIVGGGLAVLAAWWTRGRDPEIGPIADYLTAPPDDLPPAIVGALVDERVDERDIVATLVDLARGGVLQLSASPGGGWSMLTMVQQEPDLSPFEDTLLRTLFGAKFGTNRPMALVDMRARFAPEGEELRRTLYNELVLRGFFRARPSRTRIFWQAAGIILLAIAIVAEWIGVARLSDVAPAVWLPGAALLAIGLLVWLVARIMPQKTRAGAEAAAKWRAFRTYLASIDRFEHLAEAQELFDRYLPYAIVFGLEKSWVDAFSRVPTPTPGWYGAPDWPVAMPRSGAGSRSIGSAGGRASSAPSCSPLAPGPNGHCRHRRTHSLPGSIRPGTPSPRVPCSAARPMAPEADPPSAATLAPASSCRWSLAA